MRLLGFVSIVVALAIVGIAASRQLQSLGRAPTAAAPPPAPGATVRESAQQLQQQVRRDVTKALEQGAARRDDAAQ